MGAARWAGLALTGLCGAAALWWGWLVLEARADLARWQAARRDAGWQADWAGPEVSGFPARLVRRIEDVALADPATGWAWRGPWVEIAAPVTARRRLTVTLPASQVFATPRQRVDIAAGSVALDLALGPGALAPLAGATMRARAVGLISETGWRMDAARIAANFAPQGATGGALTLSATDLRPPARIFDLLAGDGRLPARIARVSADLTVRFDRPWDSRALDTERPRPVALDLRDSHLTWGRLELRAAGALTLGPTGRAEGDLLVKATNWREMLALGVDSGLVPRRIAGAVEAALELVSGLAGSPRTLDIPVRFRDGRSLIGPVPMGRAPRLQLP